MTATVPRAMRPPAAPADVVIRTKQLTKRYGETIAVDALDLSIGRGEVFGLLGPNGAGKTTTILMLLGLTEPSGGTARVDGLNPTRDTLLVKSRVGYLPDEVGFYEDLTARQNLRYTAELNRLPAPRRRRPHRRPARRRRARRRRRPARSARSRGACASASGSPMRW